eukprot:Hpha_TRINITY_DN16721_c0_g6::TRINITY_DN16721_c0_g6_i2::g.77421::m.77421
MGRQERLGPPGCLVDSGTEVGVGRRHVGRHRGLLRGQHVKHHLESQHKVLRLVTVEVPVPGAVRLEAQHSPRPLPDLERVLDQRRLQVLSRLVRRRVVGAAPVAPGLNLRVVRVPGLTLRDRALVEDLGRVPVRHQETVRLVQPAPGGKVGDVDDLKGHTVHVDHVRIRGEVLEDDLHRLGRLWDVDHRDVLLATPALAVVQRRRRRHPRPRGVVLGQVQVPAPLHQRAVGHVLVRRTHQPQVDRVPHVRLLGLGLRHPRLRHLVPLRDGQIEVCAGRHVGRRAATSAVKVLREGLLTLVVQVSEEVAGGHGVESRGDKVALGEEARIVVLSVDEVVARLLVRAHDDVNALAQVEVETTHLHRLDVISTVNRDEGHVVPRDGDLEVLGVRPRQYPPHTVTSVRLHRDQRVGVRRRPIAPHSVERTVTDVSAHVVARHRTLQLEARSRVLPLVGHEHDQILVVLELCLHGVVLALDHERSADTTRTLNRVHVRVVVVRPRGVCLETVGELLAGLDGGLRHVTRPIHVRLVEGVNAVPVDSCGLREEVVYHGDLEHVVLVRGHQRARVGSVDHVLD